MRFRKLTLENYKSFQFPTEIVFPIGVSGCRHCGFILLNPRATQGEMAHYYGLQARKPRSFVSLD